MTAELWTKLAQLLAAAGGLTTLGAAFKWLYDQFTGRSQRATTRIRSAIEAMGDAGEWADAYWQLRSYCRREHGYDGNLPEPPSAD